MNLTNIVENTAIGRYYKVYLDGAYQSQHSTEREALEKATNLVWSNPGSAVIYNHEYEVTVALTDAGLTIAGTKEGTTNQPPVIVTTPNPSFNEGQAGTYATTQNWTDDGQSTVTTSLTNALPNGLSYNGTTHILAYDGIGAATTSQHVLQVDDGVNAVVSSVSFNLIVVEDAPPVVISTPSPLFTQGNSATYDMNPHFTDDGISVITTAITGTLAAGLSYNGFTNILTYDGVGTASLNSHQLEVRDGFNPTVTSSAFNVQIQGASTGVQDKLDPGNYPWTHNTEALGQAPDVAGVWSESVDAADPPSSWNIVAGDMITGTRQFQTTLVKQGAGQSRTERSDQSYRGVDAVQVNVGGTKHWKAPQKLWYGFIMRIDRMDTTNKGYYCQWHTEGTAGGSPVVAYTVYIPSCFKFNPTRLC